jgi:nucleoid-associated protein YgaU
MQRDFRRLFTASASRILFITAATLFLDSPPLSAITQEDRGTVVRLSEKAYLVSESFLYEVRTNDNLHWLAARFYGDARQWVRIYHANREGVRNPNLLRTGQRLRIPSNKTSP